MQTISLLSFVQSKNNFLESCFDFSLSHVIIAIKNTRQFIRIHVKLRDRFSRKIQDYNRKQPSRIKRGLFLWLPIGQYTHKKSTLVILISKSVFEREGIVKIKKSQAFFSNEHPSKENNFNQSLILIFQLKCELTLRLYLQCQFYKSVLKKFGQVMKRNKCFVTRIARLWEVVRLSSLLAKLF